MPRQGLVTEVQALELSDDGLLLPSLSSKLIAGNVIIKVVMIFLKIATCFGIIPRTTLLPIPFSKYYITLSDIDRDDRH